MNISEQLAKAREYEQTHGSQIKAEERPLFHLTPYVGWMNDPNGFSYYGGQYHLFYQYYPYATAWGPMHWGHAVSKDLIHWDYLPAALAPDTFKDEGGCWSGSAVELKDGRQLLMYTCRTPETKEGFTDLYQQNQGVAVGDGLNYEKVEGLVLTGADLPQGGSYYDFRDPKMIKLPDGSLRSVMVNLKDNGIGRIVAYRSRDGFKWEFEGVLYEHDGHNGKMLECPDLFTVDGKDIILVSPMDMHADGYEYVPGNNTMAIIGHVEENSAENGGPKFVEESNQAVDYSMEFYAPQTMYAPDGRVIIIAWMQNWDTVRIREEGSKWFGQMTLPREVHVKDGRLIQTPIREIEELRTDKTEYKDIRLGMYTILTLGDVRGRANDIEIVLRDVNKDAAGTTEIRFAKGNDHYVSLKYDTARSLLTLDRMYAGVTRSFMHERTCKVTERDGEIDLRILLDRNSIEVFVNGGEQVMTTNFYTDPAEDGITFFADHEISLDVTSYKLAK